MDINLLTKLVSLIKPNEVYEFSFPTNKKITKSGLDWRATFISLNKQISPKDGLKLIQFFTNPEKETTEEIIKTKKIK